MADRIIAFDDVNERFVRTTKDPSDIASGADSRIGCETIASGVSTLSATYSTALADTNYSLNLSWENTVDATPLFQPFTVTAKSTTGFTIEWNIDTDSTNYELCYNASTNGFANVSGTETVGNGVSSKAVVINPPLADTNFSVVATISNTVDSGTQYQTPVITTKTTGGFTAKWNAPTDSANYVVEYQITNFS